MPQIDSPARAIARNVLVIVGVLLTLYIIYLLRKPITWLIIAAFLAIALAGPVNFFQRYMKRGLAIFVVYLGLLAIPIGLGAVLLPPIVTQVSDVATNAPKYVHDVEDYVHRNRTLNNLNNKYDITQKLTDEANKLPSKAGDAAKVLRDIGFGLVSSIFAGVSILILSIFMVASGPRWIESFIRMQRPEHSERIERTLRKIANAVGNYVGGALLQATIAGLASFVMLTILGVPFAGPLAVVIFVFDLIPVIGATIGAVLVGIVTAFVDFPIALIIWIVFAIVYQQIENYVIQPQIQKRATKVEAFIILVAVLFGSTLFGVLGAILAVPIAASIQIGVTEYRTYRQEVLAAEQEAGGPTPAPPPEGPTPAPEAT
jgi:predicted PurR-regulated permease PerM